MLLDKNSSFQADFIKENTQYNVCSVLLGARFKNWQGEDDEEEEKANVTTA